MALCELKKDRKVNFIHIVLTFFVLTERCSMKCLKKGNFDLLSLLISIV